MQVFKKVNEVQKLCTSSHTMSFNTVHSNSTNSSEAL